MRLSTIMLGAIGLLLVVTVLVVVALWMVGSFFYFG